MFVCLFIYRYMGERSLVLLPSCTEISMITMSLIHTGSLMILQCTSLPDKRGKNDHTAAVVLCGCFNAWPRAHLLMTTQICITFVKIKLFFLMHIYVCMCILELIKAVYKRFCNKHPTFSIVLEIHSVRAKFRDIPPWL